MARVVIAAGGTAGHVVPAIAVADALRAEGAEISFIGTRERVEADLVPAAGYEIDFIRLEGLDRRNPLRAARAATRAMAGIGAAKRILSERHANAVLGGGGYVAGPVGIAATRLGLPLVLTEADSHLGLTNRMLARRARRICLAFPIAGREGEKYLVTGRPVEDSVLSADRDAARSRFGLSRGDRCLLVFGGSQGARSINEAAFTAFAGEAGPARRIEDASEAPITVIHLAGRRDYPDLEQRLGGVGREGYQLLESEPNLGDVLAASDLVVARSGGSVFEIAAAGRPAILVPYPHATADHQTENARWMADAGAAVIVPDDELNAKRLASEAAELLDDRDRLATMAAASRALAKPDAARRVAAEVLEAVSSRPRTKRRRRMRDRKLHFIAIGGAGMSGLALVCEELGTTVTGSDRAESSYIYRMRRAGLDPRIGHDADQVPEDAEVVVSTAIGSENPELAIARERGQRVIHRGELLAELCAEKRLLAIAGTHGKTTTAAMCVHAMRALGEDPAFFLGGELLGAGDEGEASNAGWGEGDWVIAEADESDASFLELKPEIAVITNVELDHHSHWASRGDLLDAFARFAAPARVVALPTGLELPLAAPSPTDRPTPIRRSRTEEAAPYVVRYDEPELNVELPIPGRHNVANAHAALAGLELAGADRDKAEAALADFPGVARRLELKGSRDGARVYDDYAHHPTEVAAALAAARDLTRGRVIAAFQPHLYSRTKALAAEFGAALAAADEIAVLEVYPAREEPVGELAGVSGRMVAAAAADRAGGRPVWWLPDAEAAARALEARIGEGDLFITLGAGDIFELAEALVTEPA